uniref:Integrase catalytic domain-containing protein n=1 Tax=Peronospora matthiolae TaxID=2874970 RepID=A0AAV1VGZ7_9STRA
MQPSRRDVKGTKSYLWHLRLGHIGHDGLNCIVTKNIGIGIDISSVKKWDVCEGCALGKQTRVRFQSNTTARTSKLLEVIHSDVCGPMSMATFSGKRYFVTFIDDKSRYCVVYLLKSKSEVAAKFMEYAAMAETQTGKRVKYLQSDNGGEYKSDKLARFCAEQGIQQRFTPPYTPQLNGVAERMNRTLVECARCMMEHAGLGKSYWGEAVMTAMFLRNRCPTRAIHQDKSPYQVWTMKKPILANLKVFGCHAYVQVPQDKRAKFDSKSSLCRFLGYAEHQKSYRFEEVSTGAIKISRDATFMEDKFDEGPRNYNDESSVVEFDDHDEDEEKKKVKLTTTWTRATMTTKTPGLRRATSRDTRALNHLRKLPSFKSQAKNIQSGETPTTFKSAMESSDSGKWKEACDSEFDSLQRNDTWEIVPLPKVARPSGADGFFV